MSRIRLIGGCGVVLLAVGLAVGCGDDPATGTGNNGGPDAGPDATPDQNLPDQETLRNRLVLVTEPEPSVSFSQRVPMQVRYVDPDNTPIADEFITFEPQGDTGDTALSARNALSDAEGVAETFVEAGVQQLDFDVRISVPSDDTVDPITVRVRVQPKDASDYIVRVNYDGPVSLQRVEVLLYDTDRACNTLLQDPEDAPSTDVAWTSLVILPDAEGEIPERGLNVPRDIEFHYAVARGEATDGAGGSIGYFVTFGCNDEIPANDPSQATVIEIDMNNLWPEVMGTYRINSEMELLDIIPDEFQGIVESIGEFFDNPGAGILRIVALTVGGEQYWNDDTFGLFFDCSDEDPATGDCLGDVTLSSPLGVTAAGILTALVDVGIGALPDAAGNTIETVFQIGQDLFANAESFSMAGDLIIVQDPDSAGLLGNTNEVVFNKLTWTWDGRDRTVDLRESSYLRDSQEDEPGTIVAAVVFHPGEDLAETYSLDLAPFDLNLNYGEMLIWALEGIIFPEVIGICDGNLVDSFEDLFTCLVNCETLAQRMEDEGGALAIAAPIAETACATLQETAVEAIDNWLSSLTLDLGTYYHMGTPADDPCPMNLVDDMFRVQSLGGSTAANRCVWDGEIRFDDASSESEDLDGTWWGERL